MSAVYRACAHVYIYNSYTYPENAPRKSPLTYSVTAGSPYTDRAHLLIYIYMSTRKRTIGRRAHILSPSGERVQMGDRRPQAEARRVAAPSTL